jgi:hypothetical protein
MKLKFCGPQHVPAIDVDGEHEVVESQLLHRFTLVDGVAVDKYPGKTDREIMAIDHAEAILKVTAAQEAWDEDESEDKGPRPQSLPPLYVPEED